MAILKKLSLAALVFVAIWNNVNSQSIDTMIAMAADSSDIFNPMEDINSDVILVDLDMKLTKSQFQELYNEGSSRKKRKAIKASARSRWPDAVLPYTIKSGVFSESDEAQINSAMNEWMEYTCVRFRETADRDADRIMFINAKGCYSYVGRVSGTQPVGLAPGCRHKGIIVHEIGHAVGFHHEQNRPDRDEYVTIMKNNIPASVYYNFKKYSPDAVDTYGVPYDYRSVMHYGGSAFSMNGRLTIRTKNSAYQNIIGNRKGLSFRDIKLANLMYSCGKHCGQKRCPGEGFVGKDCKCWCPGNPVRKCDEATGKTDPTQQPTTPKSTAAPRCVNQNNNCPQWAEAGYCATNSYVKMFCKQSCGTCRGGGTNPSCVDDHTMCPKWAGAGYCKGIYEVYMSRKCPKSCRTCDMFGMSEEELQEILAQKKAGSGSDVMTQSFGLFMVTIATTVIKLFEL